LLSLELRDNNIEADGGFSVFSRQRALLRLVQNEGGSVSRLRLVKLAFLLSQNSCPRTAAYEFVPYKRGPFSFTLYHELRSLERAGWLVEKELDFVLTELPDLETAYLDREFLALIDSTCGRRRAVPTSSLVDEVYRDYPWFTLNAEIVQKRAVARPISAPAVYTVGYEGISVDGLLNRLLRAGIEQLVDVRSNPIARRYGFHKSTLSRLCGDVGIEYVHFASLGVPSAWRAELSDRASYERLFERYVDDILPKQEAAIAQVCRLVAARSSALMCMEANHESCHRSRLAIKVSQKTSLPVVELRTI